MRADGYGRYLDLAADWAKTLGVDADVVERALFGR
ncbi:8-oxoguanine DNA glycosylase OGG fold protein [Rhodococcoides kroppenstedtii]